MYTHPSIHIHICNTCLFIKHTPTHTHTCKYLNTSFSPRNHHQQSPFFFDRGKWANYLSLGHKGARRFLCRCTFTVIWRRFYVKGRDTGQEQKRRKENDCSACDSSSQHDKSRLLDSTTQMKWWWWWKKDGRRLSSLSLAPRHPTETNRFADESIFVNLI